MNRFLRFPSAHFFRRSLLETSSLYFSKTSLFEDEEFVAKAYFFTRKMLVSSCKKQRDQSYEGRKTAVAGDEAVGKNGDEPFSGRVDDPAARYSGCIAAKAHSHGKGLFSAGFAALEGTVQIICDPGQITKIFQKGKEREENGHAWLHIQCFAPIIPEYALYEALYLPTFDKYLARRAEH